MQKTRLVVCISCISRGAVGSSRIFGRCRLIDRVGGVRRENGSRWHEVRSGEGEVIGRKNQPGSRVIEDLGVGRVRGAGTGAVRATACDWFKCSPARSPKAQLEGLEHDERQEVLLVEERFGIMQ
jgi:hypothetical protein